MASRFLKIQQAPPIEVLEVVRRYKEDPNEKKVDLSAGAYRTEEGKPWVLPVVRKIETAMAADETLNHEYLPIFGFEPFTTAATKLVLGEDSAVFKEGRAVGIQTLSGTGAISVAANFLHKILKYTTFYESNPGWANHKHLYLHAGFTEAKQYRYWNEKTRGLDFDGMAEDLKNAPENSVIILHACAHNPTGVDPTQEQWQKLADIMEERKLFPLFDPAFQGFASGDLDKDAWAIRYFASRGFEMIITQSFAKNMGLYNERIGNMVVIVNDPSIIPQMKSQITLLLRGAYSTPPNHGARIVAKVLNDPELFTEWKGCIMTMISRIGEMRQGLNSRLQKLGTPGTWEHILNQIGMFLYTGLTAAQVKMLADKYHIYLSSNGRINMCGLNMKNIDYVAEAIDDAVKNSHDWNSKL